MARRVSPSRCLLASLLVVRDLLPAHFLRAAAAPTRFSPLRARSRGAPDTPQRPALVGGRPQASPRPRGNRALRDLHAALSCIWSFSASAAPGHCLGLLRAHGDPARCSAPQLCVFAHVRQRTLSARDTTLRRTTFLYHHASHGAHQRIPTPAIISSIKQALAHACNSQGDDQINACAAVCSCAGASTGNMRCCSANCDNICRFWRWTARWCCTERTVPYSLWRRCET